MKLRHASLTDADILWRWRNDEETRRQSHTTDLVPWDTHVAWLERILRDPTRRLYVAEIDSVPIGTGRLDDHGSVVEISLTIAPEWRGRGYARRLIQALAAEAEGRPLYAEVKAGNVRSLYAFLGAGFRREGVRGEIVCLREPPIRVLADGRLHGRPGGE